MNGMQIKGTRLESEGGQPAGLINDLLFDQAESRVEALLFTVSGVNGDFVLDVAGVAGVSPSAVRIRQDATPIPLADTPRHHDLPSLNWVIGQTVQTEDGKVLGKVSDVTVDTATWALTSFEVVGDFADAFRSGPLRITPNDLLRPGEQSITVREHSIKEEHHAQ